MRIAIFADSFPPHISGVATNCVELARRLLKAGHEVLIIAARQKGKLAVPEGLAGAHIHYIASFPVVGYPIKIAFPSPVKILRILRRFKPDVLDVQAPSFLGTDALVASKLLKVPIVSRFTTFLSSDDYLKKAFVVRRLPYAKKAGNAYIRRFYRSCNIVVCETPKSKEYLVKLGVAAEKIEINPSLFEYDKIRILSFGEREDLRAKLGIIGPAAVYMGRVSPEKGLDRLVPLWKNLALKRPDLKLFIIGGGGYEKALLRLIRREGLEGSIRFMGQFPHDELIESSTLCAFDLFISLSTSETLGIAALEAMAFGLPVVLCDSVGLSEYIDGGGFACDPSDFLCFEEAVIRLIEDRSFSSKMGENARKVAETLAGESALDRFLAIYAKALK